MALKSVFKHPAYFALAALIAMTILVFTIYLPNLNFVAEVITSSTYPLNAKFDILFSLLGSFNTNFTTMTRMMTLAVAILTGVNIAVLVFYLRKRASLERLMGASSLGTLVGLLGVGCASCGSVILSSVFGVGAAAGFIGLFPLKGVEFGLLGVALLFSTYTLLKKLELRSRVI
jgi:hypothetical protein